MKLIHLKEKSQVKVFSPDSRKKVRAYGIDSVLDGRF